jgi:hypothetical protein
MQKVIQDRPDSRKLEQESKIKSVAQEIKNLTDDKGRPFDKTPEFDRAYSRWMMGDYDNALEFVREASAKMETPKTEDDFEKRVTDEVTKRLKEKLGKEGELQSETGQPSNASLGVIQEIDKYNKGEKSFESLTESAKKRLRGY